MKKRYALIALGLLGVSPTLASAQQANVLGAWNCQQAFNQTFKNQQPSGTTWQFALQLNADGTAQYGGTETVTYGTFSFQGVGQWKRDQDGLMVNGQMSGGAKAGLAATTGYPPPPEAFNFIFITKPQSDAYMASDETRGDDRTGYFRAASQCTR